MVFKFALAAALVLGTSAAWAGQACPRMQQHAAYLALLEETSTTEPAETAKVEPAETETSAQTEDLVN